MLMETVLPLVIGTVAGLAGGMLGVGGSIVIIPALTEFIGPDQHRYQAAAMIVNFFVVAPAVWQHKRMGAFDRGTVARLLPPSIIAIVVGVGISELPLFANGGEVYLRGAFGAFLLTMGGCDIFRLVRRRSNGNENSVGDELGESSGGRPVSWSSATMIAVPVGLLAGILGVGGGLLAVPLQRRLLGLPIRVAIANSAAIIVATSMVGALVKNYAFAVEHGSASGPILLAAMMIPSAVGGSLIGSRLTHVLPIRAIKISFLLLLCVAGARLTYAAMKG
jgi:hypothetical protein